MAVPPARRPRRLPVRVLPWLAAVVVGLTMSATIPGGLLDSLRYGGWFVAVIVLPGTLLKRLLLGRGRWLADVGVGVVIGWAGLLLCWIVATAIGLPLLALGWPIGVIIAAVLVPRSMSRRGRPMAVWRAHGASPWWAHTGLVVVIMIGIWLHSADLIAKPDEVLTATNLYQDYWFHLSLNAEMLRGMPFQIPQVAGVGLQYHWFANATMAAAHQQTGVELFQILVRYWPISLFVTGALATYSLCVVAVRSAAAGLVATVIGVAAVASVQLTERRPLVTDWTIPESPSNLLGTVLTLGLGTLMIMCARAPRRPGGWVLLALLLLASAGAKPSVLPLAIAGAAAVLVGVIISGRRGRRRPVMIMTATVMLAGAVLTLAATNTISTGGNNGSTIKLFGLVQFTPFATLGIGHTDNIPGLGGPWWDNADDPVVRTMLIAGVGWLLVPLIGWFVAAAGLVHRRVRRGVEVWWTAGISLASLAAALLLDHPAVGQIYFPRGVVPIAAVAVVVVLHRLLPTDRRRVASIVLVAVAVVGGIAVRAVQYPIEEVGRPGALARSTAALVVTAFVISVLVAIGWWLATRRPGVAPRRAAEGPAIRRAAALPVIAVVLAFVTGAGVVSELAVRVPQAAWLSTAEAVPQPAAATYVSPDELAAARWLGANSAPDEVFASNAFCIPTRWDVDDCRADQFWIGAVSGRRAYLAGWAYTPLHPDDIGRERGQSYRASPWPDRLAESLAAVQDPTPQRWQALCDRGVRWLYADRRATEVPATLVDSPAAAYRNDTVVIVDLCRS